MFNIIKKIFIILSRGLIVPFLTTYELLTGKKLICSGDSFDPIQFHDWVYWDGKYICNDPNIDNFERSNDHRQCTNCKIKQGWDHWGGLGGSGEWYETNKDLPLDKSYVTTVILSKDEINKQNSKIQLEKKGLMKSNDREKRKIKILNKKKWQKESKSKKMLRRNQIGK